MESLPRVESSSCWAQLRVLLWKQRLQASRNLRATIAIVLSPVACLILSAFQLMSFVLDRAVPFLRPRLPRYASHLRGRRTELHHDDVRADGRCVGGRHHAGGCRAKRA